VRLERAMDAFHADVKKRFGVTGLQLQVLRICSERRQLPLAALRKALVMHPATLGQSIDELRRMDLVTVRTDPKDRRARLVGLTEQGAALVAAAPLAGPVRLREVDHDVARLDRLKTALEDAVDLFGLGDWDPADAKASARRSSRAVPPSPASR
jgi:DNA-binding MarR family transcriptional regulator